MITSQAVKRSERQVERQVFLKPASAVQTAFNEYKAYGIKLHMLADQFADDAQIQKEFDVQQHDCVNGQIRILNELSKHKLENANDAALMIELWSEEVGASSEKAGLSSTDRLASKIFEYVQKNQEIT